MRIIGGKFKGRKLHAPELKDTRPTTDFARENLFNILNSKGGLDDFKVLDLFSGTGAIAFECISRGAASVTCIELSGKALAFISKTAKEWNCSIHCIKSDVVRFLKYEKEKYDLIFADPPYNFAFINEIPALVYNADLLSGDGLLIIEHGKETDLKGLPNFIEERIYSRVHFSFFQKQQP